MDLIRREAVALLLACSCSLVPAAAGGVSPQAQAAARLAARPAVEWLGLTAAQQAELQESVRVRNAALAELARQAERLVAPRDQAALGRLCEQARAADQAQRQRARAVLSAQQAERMAALDQAASLLPVVESAQSAGLMGLSQQAAPAGLPQGMVRAEYVWRRSPAPALPGCPASEALPEVGLEGLPAPRPAP